MSRIVPPVDIPRAQSITRGYAGLAVEWLVISLGSFAGLFFLVPDWFFGQVRFLGAHDTEIPYLAAFNNASVLAGGGTSLWDWYGQVDFSYAHLTTGWWTIPALVEGWGWTLITQVSTLTGLDFARFHAIVWVLCQVLLLAAGYMLLLREMGIHNPWRIAVAVVAISLWSSGEILFYLTGFVYAFVPLLVFLLIRFLRSPSPETVINLFLVLGVQVAQSPLFAIGYSWVPVFIFSLAFLVTNIFLHSKSSSTTSYVRLKLSGLGVSAWRESSLNKNFVVKICLLVLIAAGYVAVLFPLTRSFRNFAMPENRLSLGPWSSVWRDRLVGFESGTSISSFLDASQNNTATLWQYLGLAFALLVVWGLFVGPFSRLVPFAVTCIAIPLLIYGNVAAQNSVDTLLKPFMLVVGHLGSLARLLLFYTFPFSFLLQSLMMLAWLLPVFASVLIAHGLQHGLVPSRRSLLNKAPIPARTCFLLLLLGSLSFSFWQASQVNVRFLTAIAFALAISLVVASSCFWVRRLHEARRSFWLVLVVLAAFIGTVSLDLALLQHSWRNPDYAGTPVTPRLFKLPQQESGEFVPEWGVPHTTASMPTVYSDAPPTVSPMSFSELSGYDETGGYFLSQTNSAMFWQTILLFRFGSNTYYQQTHKVLDSLVRDDNARARWTSLVSIGPSGPKSDEEYGPCLHAAPAPERYNTALGRRITLTKVNRTIRNPLVAAETLYEFKLPVDLADLQSRVFSPRRFSVTVDDRLAPIGQGMPVNGTVDVGNWRAGFLTVSQQSSENEPKVLLTLGGLPSFENQYGVLQNAEIRDGRLSGQITMNQDGCLHLMEPYEAGWAGVIDGEISKVLDVDGFVAIPITKGTHKLEMSPGSGPEQYWITQVFAAFCLVALILVGVSAPNHTRWRSKRGILREPRRKE